MGRIVTLGVVLALLSSNTAAWAEPVNGGSNGAAIMEPQTRFDDVLLEGVTLLNDGKPSEAEAIFTRIIAAYESSHDPAVPYRCATTQTASATIAYSLKTLNGSKFILGSEEWCTALWGKGFALIDLGKSDVAGPFLARAVAMDPINAHFINEYAEWFKPQRQWQQSYDLFLRAWRTVDHNKRGPNRRVAARALRGMAFNMIELGDLNEAERLFRQSLEYEPEAAAKVQGELDYISQVRSERKAS